MSTARGEKKISLLPQEDFEKSSFGRVLTWALSAGRVIVITTELIVVIAFLSRFWFDRTLTDLNEEIEQKSKLVQAQKSLETEFRNVQNRIIQARDTDTKEQKIKLAQDILGKVPAEIRLDKVSAEKDLIVVDGISLSEAAVEGFIISLEKLNIGVVSLSQLSTNPQGSIKFSLRIKPT